ncbi:hypothetical protein QAD02_006783 [Eretmocerus hayati]|uniref:Uncharacterized protein n=1 Tax=Eretmocerus hayati TaxID=131215 RepID=A0ACC2N268_9HYME|nr:hypothetical protein QAD02_006783 [Eretmocerus hayati]
MNTCNILLLIFFFLVPCLLSYPQNETVIPKTITYCTRESKDYTDCLTNAIQELWDIFVRGIPEFDITPRDPLVLETIKDNYKTKDVSTFLHLRNLTIFGLKDTKFLRTRVNFTDNRIKLEVDQQIPYLYVESTHEVNGSISGVQVDGQGYFNLSMTNTTGTWCLDGRVENDRWIIEHFLISKETAQKVKIYFTDLFKGHPELNEATLQLVNEFWEVFFEGIQPLINMIGDARSTEFFNEKIFSKVPISKIFH